MRIFAVLFPLLLSAPALAQSTDQQTQPIGRPGGTASDEWTVTVGVAPIFSPAWEGSDDMILSIFPDVRINYGDEVFASVPDGVGWNAVNDNGWKVGPQAKLRFGRDEDGSGSPRSRAGATP